MRQMLKVCLVGRKLLNAGQSFHVDSRACVMVVMDMCEWFPGNVGLGQDCVMSHACLMCSVWCGAREE